MATILAGNRAARDVLELPRKMQGLGEENKDLIWGQEAKQNLHVPKQLSTPQIQQSHFDFSLANTSWVLANKQGQMFIPWICLFSITRDFLEGFIFPFPFFFQTLLYFILFYYRFGLLLAILDGE